eukprot:TRINITY_DN21002_c0_g1_i1.p1 TRINITY_DN21002_c0_g1~~TRINITY_DN21002_c0_g1_i1.p1  ORF type:complete len:300 (+),score=39.19 TRINITY_DN21002_c0_g1_i1:54-902(+)
MAKAIASSLPLCVNCIPHERDSVSLHCSVKATCSFLHSGDSTKWQKYLCHRAPVRQWRHRKSSVSWSASLAVESEPLGEGYTDVRDLKTALLAAVAGLDRGLAAGEEELQVVEAAAEALEVTMRVELPADLDQLSGRWRLVFSSGFSSGSFGGRRPGPPVGRLPLTLGQVYQRIDVVSRELDNIVDIRIGAPWPLPSLELNATLAHSFEVIGENEIRIIFESTTVRAEGPLKQLPPLAIPQLPEALRPPSSARSGDFKTTFLDNELRVSRGDRGELRVFVRA